MEKSWHYVTFKFIPFRISCSNFDRSFGTTDDTLGSSWCVSSRKCAESSVRTPLRQRLFSPKVTEFEADGLAALAWGDVDCG